MSSQNQDLVVVGKLGATYGIKGWLKVFFPTLNSLKVFSPISLGLLKLRVNGSQSRLNPGRSMVREWWLS